MRSKILTPVLILLTLLVSQANAEPLSQEILEHSKGCYRGARTPALIVNHDNIAIKSGSGKPLGMKQIKETIVKAGRENRWSFQSQEDGKLLATLHVRGKHTVIVEIAYSPTQYSIHYKDSVNMHHAVCDSYTFIHPNYNTWVTQLKDIIQLRLTEM